MHKLAIKKPHESILMLLRYRTSGHNASVVYHMRETAIVYITVVNIESLIRCHLLLNLLHELANMILCEALPSIISFLPTNVINLVINDNEYEILFIT